MTARILLSALTLSAASLSAQELRGWPPGVAEIRVTSSADRTEQPALAFSPEDATDERPLLVGLHTWGGGYTQASNGSIYARWAAEQGWHFVYPHFRGPNTTPAALGSDLAVQDVVDAVRHMQKNAKVDATRIYLIGASGGGHMALLMAGRHPEIWAGVSSWVPITDVAAWHAEHFKDGKPDNYAKNIEGALGGPPDNAQRLKDAKNRSPNTWLARAQDVPLDINHGVHDGRKGSVPFRHSLHAFNLVASAEERLPEKEIAAFYDTQQLPAGWEQPQPDPLYGEQSVLFRRVSGNARVTIFEGGHQILYAPALNWLAQQQKGRPAVWHINDPKPVGHADTRSGK